MFSNDHVVVDASTDDNSTVLVKALDVGEAVVKLWMPASALEFAVLQAVGCVHWRPPTVFLGGLWSI